MSRSLTSSDKSALIRLASSLPAGSAERKAVLAGLKKVSEEVQSYDASADLRSALQAEARNIWGGEYTTDTRKDTLYFVLQGAEDLWRGGGNWSSFKELQAQRDDGDVSDFFSAAERILKKLGPGAEYYPINKLGIVYENDGKAVAKSVDLSSEKARLFPKAVEPAEPAPVRDEGAESAARAWETFKREFEAGIQGRLLQSKYWGVLIQAVPKDFDSKTPPKWFLKQPLQTVPVDFYSNVGLDLKAVNDLIDSGITPEQVYEELLASAGRFSGTPSMEPFFRSWYDYAKKYPTSSARATRFALNDYRAKFWIATKKSGIGFLTRKHVFSSGNFKGYDKGGVTEVTNANFSKARTFKLGK
jgi:hypothetical protein